MGCNESIRIPASNELAAETVVYGFIGRMKEESGNERKATKISKMKVVQRTRKLQDLISQQAVVVPKDVGRSTVGLRPNLHLAVRRVLKLDVPSSSFTRKILNGGVTKAIAK